MSAVALPKPVELTRVERHHQERQGGLLKKAAGALTMRTVSEVEPTFLQRKAFNAMLHVAQRPENSKKLSYEIGFKEMEDYIGLSSNNRKHVAQMIDGLTSIKVHFDWRGEGKAGTWGTAVLVAEIYVDESAKVYRYSFPVHLREKLIDPEMYNRIDDFRIQKQFSSYSALTLYEIVSRYQGSPTRRTFKEHWTTWSLLLSGANQPHSQYREFNKMLTRAVEQVNTIINDFRVIIHTSGSGRKVESIWFEIDHTNKTPQLFDDNPIDQDGSIIERCLKIGMTPIETQAILNHHEEEYVGAQVDYTIKRCSDTSKPTLTNPKSFLYAAIEHNYAKSPKKTKTQETHNSNHNQINPGEMTTLINSLQPVLESKYPTAWNQFKRVGYPTKALMGAISKEIKQLAGEQTSSEPCLLESSPIEAELQHSEMDRS